MYLAIIKQYVCPAFPDGLQYNIDELLKQNGVERWKGVTMIDFKDCYDDLVEWYNKICPRCHNEVSDNRYYCTYCGQALDWGEDE